MEVLSQGVNRALLPLPMHAVPALHLLLPRPVWLQSKMKLELELVLEVVLELVLMLELELELGLGRGLELGLMLVPEATMPMLCLHPLRIGGSAALGDPPRASLSCRACADATLQPLR